MSKIISLQAENIKRLKAVKIKPGTRGALMAMLAERGIKEREDRLEFAYAAGVRMIREPGIGDDDDPIKSFNDLYEDQAIYLCRVVERRPKVS